MLRLNYLAIAKAVKFDTKAIYRVLCYKMEVASTEGSITQREQQIGTTFPRGDNYIVNLKAVLQDRMSSHVHKMQYIALACKRNYANYELLQDTTLDEMIVDNTYFIQTNRLLKVKHGKIHFKFEQENNKCQ